MHRFPTREAASLVSLATPPGHGAIQPPKLPAPVQWRAGKVLNPDQILARADTIKMFFGASYLAANCDCKLCTAAAKLNHRQTHKIKINLPPKCRRVSSGTVSGQIDESMTTWRAETSTGTLAKRSLDSDQLTCAMFDALWRGHSSVGRALAWLHARGRWFNPIWLHHALWRASRVCTGLRASFARAVLSSRSRAGGT
jgi:hypothetical protein